MAIHDLTLVYEMEGMDGVRQYIRDHEIPDTDQIEIDGEVSYVDTLMQDVDRSEGMDL